MNIVYDFHNKYIAKYSLFISKLLNPVGPVSCRHLLLKMFTIQTTGKREENIKARSKVS